MSTKKQSKMVNIEAFIYKDSIKDKIKYLEELEYRNSKLMCSAVNGRAQVYRLIKNSSHCYSGWDYSTYHHFKCLGCSFCYTKAFGYDKVKNSDRLMKVMPLAEAKKLQKKYMKPITIGKYTDVFFNGMIARGIKGFIETALPYKNKVVVHLMRDWLPEWFFEYCVKYKDQISVCLVMFSDDTKDGKMLSSIFAKKRGRWHKKIALILRLQSMGITVTVKFDPVIIGLNEDIIDNMITELEKIGVNKFIFKPLCSTKYFLDKLSMVSSRLASMLTVTNDEELFYHYPTDTVIDCLFPIILKHPDSSFSFCENKYLNEILGITNCCQSEG